MVHSERGGASCLYNEFFLRAEMQTTVCMSYSTGYRECEDDEKSVETSDQNNTKTVGKLK